MVISVKIRIFGKQLIRNTMAKDTTNRREPVKVRTRAMKTGGASVFLDVHHAGVRRQIRLNIFLRPEKTRADKQWNKDQLKLADAVKAQYIIEIQNGTYGLKDLERTGKINLIKYCREMSQQYRDNGQKACAVLLDSTIRRLIAYRGEAISLAQVDKDYLLGFIEYLHNNTNQFDRKAKDPKRKKKPISDVYKEALYARLMVALNKAERDGLIAKNPGKTLDNKFKPHAEPKERCFLTLEEVKAIIDTEYTLHNDVKPAFLFACFTGLRHSDLAKLTWGEILTAPDGSTMLQTQMQKTKKPITIPLSDNALAYLPERGKAKKGDRVFPNLPDQPGNADVRLRTIAQRAGIDKRVTFHVARHTFATLTLTYGADLYTVSKLLGHSNVKTTQIYAKIVDENKKKAVNLIPKL